MKFRGLKGAKENKWQKMRKQCRIWIKPALDLIISQGKTKQRVFGVGFVQN